MFGIVNTALKDMLTEHYGQEKWLEIKNKAGLDEDDFLITQNYPDKIIEQIMEAVTDTLKDSPSKITEDFGGYWYDYTMKNGYRELIEATGNTFPEFLQNLNEMHAKISLLYPGMRAPIFKCRDVTESSLTLHYYSTREGFGPVVVGAVHKMADRFDLKATVERIQCVEDGADHDIFHIKY